MNKLLNVSTGIFCLFCLSIFGGLGYIAGPPMIIAICVAVALVDYLGTRLKSTDVELVLSGVLISASVAIGYWIQTHMWVNSVIVFIAVWLSSIIGTLQDVEVIDPVYYQATRRLR